MHRSLGSATLACLPTTWVIVPGLLAQNKLYTFYGDSAMCYLRPFAASVMFAIHGMMPPRTASAVTS